MTWQILRPTPTTIPMLAGLTKTLITTFLTSAEIYRQLPRSVSSTTLMTIWKVSAPLRREALLSMRNPTNTSSIASNLYYDQTKRSTVLDRTPTVSKISTARTSHGPRRRIFSDGSSTPSSKSSTCLLHNSSGSAWYLRLPPPSKKRTSIYGWLQLIDTLYILIIHISGRTGFFYYLQYPLYCAVCILLNLAVQ